MKIIDDELLNNFIDDDLSVEDRQFLKNEIENNIEIKKRYESLLLIHNSLKNSGVETTSIDFTRTIMDKISKNKLRSAQQKRFLIFILSLFGIVTLGIVAYLLYQLFSGITFTSSGKVVSDYSKDFGDYITALFGKKNLSIFGSILSFIMLVGGYFLFEYQKSMKKHMSH